MLRFILVLPDGYAINEQTKINSSKGTSYIKTELELCNLMKSIWMKATQSKSFTDWAEELNADPNFEGGFTKEDAISNLGNLFFLNIKGEGVSVTDFFLKHKPFKNLQAQN